MNTLAMTVALVAAVAAASASAQSAAGKTTSQNAPKPPPELAQLDSFVGTWTCTGGAHASSAGAEHPTRLHVTVTRDLGGFVYGFRFAEEKTKENPLPAAGTGFWAYDPVQKQLVAHTADNFGGTFVQRSKGWTADAMTWEGEGVAMGDKVKVRDVFTRAGDELSHHYEAELDGKWVTLADEKCRKTKRGPSTGR
jgi:hypothetical protein